MGVAFLSEMPVPAIYFRKKQRGWTALKDGGRGSKTTTIYYQTDCHF